VREQPLTINCATLPVDPATNRKFQVGIPIEEGRLIKRILRTSPGTPNQRSRWHTEDDHTLAGPGQTVNATLS
jgi:hypothetical protein